MFDTRPEGVMLNGITRQFHLYMEYKNKTKEQTKQNKTHRYRGQIGSYQIGKGKEVGEMGEGGQLYGN